MDWIYGQIVGFLGNFFALMGNMGVELFELEWVSAIILFFSRLAWALFAVSVVVCAFECGIEYSTAGDIYYIHTAGVQFTVRNPRQYVTIPLSREIGVFLLWNIYMTDKMVEAYLKALENEERAAATIEKYRRALLSFAAFLSGAAVTREMIRLWKDDLRASNYAPSTINACLAALNGFFCFCGWTDCRARFLKIQRRLFRDSRQELTRGEYERLVAAAEATGDRSLALLIHS